MPNFNKKALVSLGCSLILASMFGIVGCASSSSPAELPHQQENTSQVRETASYYELGINLLKNIETDDGNTLVSPVSLTRPLAALATGAEGETKSQIESILGFQNGVSTNEIKDLAKSWNSSSDTFAIADSVWINSSFEPKQSFIDTAKGDFGAEIFDEDFNTTTLGEINDWVDEKTHGMIPEILSEISPSAPMIVMDACAFEDDWAVPFDQEDISDAEFENADGSFPEVEMMREHVNYGYCEDDVCTALVKNYDDSKYAFVGILPKDEDISLDEFLSDIDGDTIADLVAGVQDTDVVKVIPKFSGEYTLPLAGVLQKLGMSDAFSSTKADFSGIGDGVYIDDVLQKTYVDLTAEGTRAAAATSTSVELSDVASEPEPEPEPKYVILDRPFVYAIVDTDTNVPLFMGMMSNF